MLQDAEAADAIVFSAVDLNGSGPGAGPPIIVQQMVSVPPGQVVTICGDSTGKTTPRQVAVDSRDDIFWTDENDETFTTPRTGNVRIMPLRKNVAKGSYGLPGTKSPALFAGDVAFIVTGSSTTVPQAGAFLNCPRGIAVDPRVGNLWLADRLASSVYSLRATDGFVTQYGPFTSGGAPNPGFSGDGGIATNAQLDSPTACAVDGLGNVYILDALNLRVRRARQFP